MVTGPRNIGDPVAKFQNFGVYVRTESQKIFMICPDHIWHPPIFKIFVRTAQVASKSNKFVRMQTRGFRNCRLCSDYKAEMYCIACFYSLTDQNKTNGTKQKMKMKIIIINKILLQSRFKPMTFYKPAQHLSHPLPVYHITYVWTSRLDLLISPEHVRIMQVNHHKILSFLSRLHQ